MSIESYSFKDTDVTLSSKKNLDYSVSLKIEHKVNVTVPTEYAYMFLARRDVIALAKHFKLTIDDIKE